MRWFFSLSSIAKKKKYMFPWESMDHFSPLSFPCELPFFLCSIAGILRWEWEIRCDKCINRIHNTIIIFGTSTPITPEDYSISWLERHDILSESCRRRECSRIRIIGWDGSESESSKILLDRFRIDSIPSSQELTSCEWSDESNIRISPDASSSIWFRHISPRSENSIFRRRYSCQTLDHHRSSCCFTGELVLLDEEMIFRRNIKCRNRTIPKNQCSREFSRSIENCLSLKNDAISQGTLRIGFDQSPEWDDLSSIWVESGNISRIECMRSIWNRECENTCKQNWEKSVHDILW